MTLWRQKLVVQSDEKMASGASEEIVSRANQLDFACCRAAEIRRETQAHDQPVCEDVQASDLRGVTRGMCLWSAVSAPCNKREQDWVRKSSLHLVLRMLIAHIYRQDLRYRLAKRDGPAVKRSRFTDLGLLA